MTLLVASVNLQICLEQGLIMEGAGLFINDELWLDEIGCSLSVTCWLVQDARLSKRFTLPRLINTKRNLPNCSTTLHPLMRFLQPLKR